MYICTLHIHMYVGVNYFQPFPNILWVAKLLSAVCTHVLPCHAFIHLSDCANRNDKGRLRVWQRFLRTNKHFHVARPWQTEE